MVIDVKKLWVLELGGVWEVEVGEETQKDKSMVSLLGTRTRNLLGTRFQLPAGFAPVSVLSHYNGAGLDLGREIRLR